MGKVIELEEIRLGERKKEIKPENIFIGTPAYNSMCHTDYLHSIVSYHTNNIPVAIMTLGNESLITRGRNTILSYYFYIMKNDFTNLLFLDADIYFPAEGLKKLLSHQKDVIGVPVKLKGFDKEGNPVFNIGKILDKPKDDLWVVDKIGTAVFMLSNKAVKGLVDYARENNLTYMSNPHTRGDAQNIIMYDVFPVGVYNGEYLSEDYGACRILKEKGFEIYVDPTIKVRHNGMFSF